MWMEVVSGAGFNYGEECLTDHCYPDSDTYLLANSVAELTKMTSEEMWEVFGRFFVEYALERGWEDVIRSIGPNLKVRLVSRK
ncbi:unnamed protein product [Cylicocyclus nassatus]|uniref:Heme NO-binding domain-containing protein n=1 Tax=Cylicocyclus nassatus TaxID=53992 RepID=A0AA36GRR0_CYLNA|nr:unnamed protein product [Cylicocyclus nassatus]